MAALQIIVKNTLRIINQIFDFQINPLIQYHNRKNLNFAVFVDINNENFASNLFPHTYYSQNPVILKNKIIKLLKLVHPQNIDPQIFV